MVGAIIYTIQENIPSVESLWKSETSIIRYNSQINMSTFVSVEYLYNGGRKLQQFDEFVRRSVLAWHENLLILEIQISLNLCKHCRSKLSPAYH